MKKSILMTIALLLTIGSLSACTNKQMGTAGGAALGGVAGYAVGGGVGAAVGAVGGGLIGNAVTN